MNNSDSTSWRRYPFTVLCEEQARSRSVLEFGGDGFTEEGEEVPALLLADGERCPHSFVVTLPRFTACALGDPTIDHTVANLLFAMIVGRLQPFGKEKVSVPVLWSHLRGNSCRTAVRSGELSDTVISATPGSDSSA